MNKKPIIDEPKRRFKVFGDPTNRKQKYAKVSKKFDIDIPKSLIGLGIIGLGAIVANVPLIAVASSYLITTGITIFLYGIGMKINRKLLKGDLLNKYEKSIINKLKGENRG